MTRLLLAVCFLALIGAVDARAFTNDALGRVDRTVTFIELAENPEAYLGKHILLGGTIVSAEETVRGTELDIDQLPLDADRRPSDQFASGGRFRAVSPKRLDPADYRPGTMVTLIGEVTGKVVAEYDDEEETSPLLLVREIESWKRLGADRGYGPPGADEPQPYVVHEYVYPSYPTYPYYRPYYPWWPGGVIIIEKFPRHHRHHIIHSPPKFEKFDRHHRIHRHQKFDKHFKHQPGPHRRGGRR